MCLCKLLAAEPIQDEFLIQADIHKVLGFVVTELEKLLNQGDLGDRANLFMTIAQDLPCAECIYLTFKEQLFFKRTVASI